MMKKLDRVDFFISLQRVFIITFKWKHIKVKKKMSYTYESTVKGCLFIDLVSTPYLISTSISYETRKEK